MILAVFASVWVHDRPSLVVGAAVAAGIYAAFAGPVGVAAWRVEFIADWQTVLQG